MGGVIWDSVHWGVCVITLLLDFVTLNLNDCFIFEYSDWFQNGNRKDHHKEMMAFNLEDCGVTKQKQQGFLMQSVGDKIYDSDNDSVDNDTEYVTVTMTIG